MGSNRLVRSPLALIALSAAGVAWWFLGDGSREQDGRERRAPLYEASATSSEPSADLTTGHRSADPGDSSVTRDAALAPRREVLDEVERIHGTVFFAGRDEVERPRSGRLIVHVERFGREEKIEAVVEEGRFEFDISGSSLVLDLELTLAGHPCFVNAGRDPDGSLNLFAAWVGMQHFDVVDFDDGRPLRDVVAWRRDDSGDGRPFSQRFEPGDLLARNESSPLEFRPRSKNWRSGRISSGWVGAAGHGWALIEFDPTTDTTHVVRLPRAGELAISLTNCQRVVDPHSSAEERDSGDDSLQPRISLRSPDVWSPTDRVELLPEPDGPTILTGLPPASYEIEVVLPGIAATGDAPSVPRAPTPLATATAVVRAGQRTVVSLRLADMPMWAEPDRTAR